MDEGIELPDTLSVYSGPYPDEDRLAQISAADSIKDGPRWLVDTFPKLVTELAPYGQCEVTHGVGILGNPEFVISFSTGGWSGCEDFIDAVLQNTMLNVMYYSAWKRGGHYEFRVSESQYRGNK